MSDEAATTEHGGPLGPVDASWLILQRLSDLKEQMADLRRGQDALSMKIESLDAKLESKIGSLDAKLDSFRKELDTKIESVRTWSVGILLLAVIGLLVKLFLPVL